MFNFVFAIITIFDATFENLKRGKLNKTFKCSQGAFIVDFASTGAPLLNSDTFFELYLLNLPVIRHHVFFRTLLLHWEHLYKYQSST